MRRIILSFFLCSILPASLLSQEVSKNAFSIIEKREEVYVALPKTHIKHLDSPFSLPGFVRSGRDSVFLCLSRKDSSFIKKNEKLLHILPAPSMLRKITTSNVAGDVLKGKAYPTYPLYLEIMDYFRDSFPEICTIDTIGYSVNNRLILAARLAKTGNSVGKVPVGFYSSTIHGDETAGFVFMLMLIQHFLKGEDAIAENILNDMLVIINPLANPDGTYFTSDSTVFGATRMNALGTDLNRNYPDPQDGSHPDGNPWQRETIAMMGYMDTIKPSISVNFHSGAEVVNYPFDTWALRHADDEWFRFISTEYARQARALQPGYMDAFRLGITNGYSWYEVNGGRQDYVTYFLRGRETTIELSDTKLLPEDELSALWEVNRNSMINYLRQGLYGVHGTISDSLTSESIFAEISVLNHDKLNSEIFSHPETGRFFRYLKEGVYDFQIEAAGYRTKRISGLMIRDYERRNYEIKMIPDHILPDQFKVNVGQNPFLKEFTVFLEMKDPDHVFFRIYDIYGNCVFHEFAYLTAGYHEYSIEPAAAPGVYLLIVNSGDRVKDYRIVKLE